MKNKPWKASAACNRVSYPRPSIQPKVLMIIPEERTAIFFLN